MSAIGSNRGAQVGMGPLWSKFWATQELDCTLTSKSIAPGLGTGSLSSKLVTIDSLFTECNQNEWYQHLPVQNIVEHF